MAAQNDEISQMHSMFCWLNRTLLLFPLYFPSRLHTSSVIDVPIKFWDFFWKLDTKWVENEISSEEFSLVAEKAVRQYFNSLFRIMLFELYSTDQIPLCLIRLFSITSYFLVNNLHFITYSNRIIQYQKIHRKPNATDSELCT